MHDQDYSVEDDFVDCNAQDKQAGWKRDVPVSVVHE